MATIEISGKGLKFSPQGMAISIPGTNAGIGYSAESRELVIDGLGEKDRVITRSDSRDGSQKVIIVFG